MVYSKTLPRIDGILALAKLVDSFPITVHKILEIAKLRGSSESLQNFLRLFPDNEIFESAEEFMVRSIELEILIREERKAEEEISRSP